MADPEFRFKRQKRRKDHIAKDLRTPKYRERAVKVVRQEDEDERRWRKFKDLDGYIAYDPLMYEDDED